MWKKSPTDHAAIGAAGAVGAAPSPRRTAAAALLALAAAMPSPGAATPAHAEAAAPAPTVRYRAISIDGVDVFYREAGPADAPAILLLHGFPTSSHMFRNLIPALADLKTARR